MGGDLKSLLVMVTIVPAYFRFGPGLYFEGQFEDQWLTPMQPSPSPLSYSVYHAIDWYLRTYISHSLINWHEGRSPIGIYAVDSILQSSPLDRSILLCEFIIGKSEQLSVHRGMW